MVVQSEPSGASIPRQDRSDRTPIPVVLLTFGVVLLVLVVVVVLVVLEADRTRRRQARTPTPVQQASTALVQEVTDDPGERLRLGRRPVCTGDLGRDRQWSSGAPTLTITGFLRWSGSGSLYCPACAAERWALVIALGRFGTFRQALHDDVGRVRGVRRHCRRSASTARSTASRTVALSAVEEYGNHRFTRRPGGFAAARAPEHSPVVGDEGLRPRALLPIPRCCRSWTSPTG